MPLRNIFSGLVIDKTESRQQVANRIDIRSHCRKVSCLPDGKLFSGDFRNNQAQKGAENDHDCQPVVELKKKKSVHKQLKHCLDDSHPAFDILFASGDVVIENRNIIGHIVLLKISVIF